MDGNGYEDWCASWLRRQGFRNVQKTKASHDQGIDLIAQRGNLSWGFQCKYYSSSIGNEAIMQAYAGKAYYGLDKAGVITNSTFTASAVQLAEQTDIILYENIAPKQRNSGTILIRVCALILLIMCIPLFSRLIEADNESGFIPAAFAFLGSLCALVFAPKAAGLFFAALMLGISLSVYLFAHTLADLFFISLLLFFMLVLIRMIVLLKAESRQKAVKQKAQLRQLINQKRLDLAQEIARLLSVQLEKEVVVDEVSENGRGTLTIRAHARNISPQDLGLAVYTLNQHASMEEENLHFAYLMEEGSHFMLVCEKAS